MRFGYEKSTFEETRGQKTHHSTLGNHVAAVLPPDGAFSFLAADNVAS